jgi:hypothetical protein
MPCTTNGRGVYIGYWWGSQKKRGHYNMCRWMDNIEMNLRKIGWDGMDWIDLSQDRDQWRALVKTAINLRVP